MQTIYTLKGQVQHYAWGGFHFIPQLLNLDNKEQKPFAEYWLGAHPIFCSAVQNKKGVLSLIELIRDNKEVVLGEAVAHKFDALPFLAKVLDVRQMLSIQVHPSKEGAKIGFDGENEKGIPLTAPHRNYKDGNHKPEMMVALSDFWLLHGFKQEQELAATLYEVPELNFLSPLFENGNYKQLYSEVMSMDGLKANSILHGLAERILPLYDAEKLDKSSADFWAAKAIKTFCKDGQYDRGIFSIYFFNLLHLKEGEGIFQPAGLPHAYLQGQNVEVMANSDNVLRGGLTDKHIDVAELMKHIKFEATVPDILHTRADHSYNTPAEEFMLYKYSSLPLDNFTAKGPEVILVLEGELVLKNGAEELALKKGEAAFITAGTAINFVQQQQDSTCYRVVVPGV